MAVGDKYETLVNSVINKSVLTPFREEITELSKNYVGPVYTFSTKNESMLENAFGGNPFKLGHKDERDHFNISPLLMGNGQAYIDTVADMRNTYTNLNNNLTYNVKISTKDGNNSAVNDSTTMENIANVSTHGSGSIGDDDMAYMNLVNKYTNMQNTVYTGQGKRIKTTSVRNTIHSARHNASTVVIDNAVTKPTIKACLIDYTNEADKPDGINNTHENYSMLFLDVMYVSSDTPKTIINYISSQQMFYKIADTIREYMEVETNQLSDGQIFSVNVDIKCTGMFFKNLPNKFINKGVMSTFESPKIDCIDIVIEKMNISDMIDIYYGKLPELLIIECADDVQISDEKIARRRVLTGMELCNSKYKTVCFNFLMDLERQGSVIYDSPAMPTRMFIDAAMNTVYRYYDNLRFTPMIESIYTRVFPSLYFVWSKLFSIGENYLECSVMFDQIINKIIESVRDNNSKFKDINALRKYLESVHTVLSCMKQMYVFPVHRKYSTNRMLAFMSCGNFYANLKNAVVLVARTGLDVNFDKSKHDLLNIDIKNVAVREDIGKGSINYALGSLNLSSFLGMSVKDINKTIEQLKMCGDVNSGGYYKGNDCIVECDTGRTYKFVPGKSLTSNDMKIMDAENDKKMLTAYSRRLGSHLFELETVLNPDTVLKDSSKLYDMNSVLEGFLFGICHNTGYSLLLSKEQFMNTRGKLFMSDNMPTTLRKILWWVHCLNLNTIKDPLGIDMQTPSEACLNDRVVYVKIADKLFKQNTVLPFFDFETGNFQYYYGNSSYVTGREHGFMYKPLSNLIMPGDSTHTESTLLAKTLLEFMKNARQSQHVINVMYGHIYNLLRGIQLPYGDSRLPERIYQAVAEEFPALVEALPIEAVSEYVDCIYMNKSVFESGIIQNSANKMLEINMTGIKDYVIKTNESFNGVDYSLSAPLVENTMSYITGRLGFIKESCVFLEGGTNKVKYQNNAISLYPNVYGKPGNLDIRCISPFTLRHGTLVPIAKKL